jgi:SAM-dependent methyltransferase
MKQSALATLVCPRSLEPLTAEVFAREGGEIIDGILRGSLGDVYPIIRGVPRMLPADLRKHLAADYPEFFKEYHSWLNSPASGTAGNVAVRRHTQEAFGHEWTWASDYDADNFSDWLPAGFSPEALFSDRVGLEVGCGAGRHAARTADVSKAHFAVDLSRAVDSAFARNRHRSNCHVVQADAFSLPFRPRSFDYVYCLGVLQHMHDPPAGFRALAKFPQVGGTLLVNVYQAGRPLTIGALSLIRRISTQLTNKQLQAISEIAGGIEYALITSPWKAIKDTSVGRVFAPIVPARVKEYARHSRRTAIVDWFDRLSCPVKIHYRREDLAGWFAESGYKDIVVTPYWKAFWNGYGVRQTP